MSSQLNHFLTKRCRTKYTADDGFISYTGDSTRGVQGTGAIFVPGIFTKQFFLSFFLSFYFCLVARLCVHKHISIVFLANFYLLLCTLPSSTQTLFSETMFQFFIKSKDFPQTFKTELMETFSNVNIFHHSINLLEKVCRFQKQFNLKHFKEYFHLDNN